MQVLTYASSGMINEEEFQKMVVDLATYDEKREQVIKRSRGTSLGPSSPLTTSLGPLSTEPQTLVRRWEFRGCGFAEGTRNARKRSLRRCYRYSEEREAGDILAAPRRN
jgi:hypothetical protein